jgi:hypothetical protein
MSRRLLGGEAGVNYEPVTDGCCQSDLLPTACDFQLENRVICYPCLRRKFKPGTAISKEHACLIECVELVISVLSSRGIINPSHEILQGLADASVLVRDTGESREDVSAEDVGFPDQTMI